MRIAFKAVFNKDSGHRDKRIDFYVPSTYCGTARWCAVKARQKYKKKIGVKFDASHWIFHNEYFTIQNTTQIQTVCMQTCFGNWSFGVRRCRHCSIDNLPHHVVLKVSQCASVLPFKWNSIHRMPKIMILIIVCYVK